MTKIRQKEYYTINIKEHYALSNSISLSLKSKGVLVNDMSLTQIDN